MSGNNNINTMTIDEIDKIREAKMKAKEEAEEWTKINFSTKLTEGLDDASNKLKELGISMPGVGTMLKTFMQESGESSKEMAKIMVASFGIATNAMVRNIANPAKDTSDIIGQLPEQFKNLNDAMRGLVQTEDLARTAIMSTTGGMESWSDRMAEANKIATNYPASIQQSAAATGFFGKELIALDKAAKHIPSTFQTMTISADEFGGVLKSTIIQKSHAVALALRGLHYTISETGPMLDKLYQTFNQQGREAIAGLGEISGAAKIAVVDTKIATEQISSASSGFAIFGQGVSAAARTWADFNLALKDTVPVSEIGKMVGTVTSGLAKMSLQHRAFITQVSGAQPGTSMLGGALKMEMAMRSPGGLEKNMDALTQTLSQFAGGKIITLEQAIEMPELETQFVLQRNLLKDLTGVSGNEEQNRVLEVLKKVQSGGMTQIEGGKAVGDMMKTGQSLQEKSLTAIETLVQAVRPFTLPLTTFLRKANLPAQAGGRELGRQVAVHTSKIGETPNLGAVAAHGLQIMEEVKQAYASGQPAAGTSRTPTREDFSQLLFVPERKKEGTKTIPVFSGIGPTKHTKANRIQAYSKSSGSSTRTQPVSISSGSSTRTQPVSISTRAMAEMGITKAIGTISELIVKVDENTGMTKRQIETPVKINLDMICPGCHKNQIDKLMADKNGTHRRIV